MVKPEPGGVLRIIIPRQVNLTRTRREHEEKTPSRVEEVAATSANARCGIPGLAIQQKADIWK